MQGNDKSNLFKIPYGSLGIVSLKGSCELGNLVDQWITEWRHETIKEFPEINKLTLNYAQNSYQISHNCNRFATGEGKVVINETVRDHDIFILADIGNYNCTYTMYGKERAMSPDDHFSDIKRAIGAMSGRAKRISVITPLLYEGRQHKRSSRESLDCAIGLQELINMGVSNIITFDAHDPRVQNSIPLNSFENLCPHYQIIKSLIKTEKNLNINKEKMIIVSPDEGGLQRNIYYASMLGLNVSTFYKRRDYTKIVNGKNPIISHEYLGDNLNGKDVLIADDLIASGESILDVAGELKKRNASRIFVTVTFAQFTHGIEKFNEAYDQGIISKVFATNLSYRRPEVLSAPWFVDVNMSKYTAYLIEMLNHDQSLSPLADPSEKITSFLKCKGIK
ncbi:MAG: ribose-phosphate pyrophosphokinase [Clostridiales bacterium]